MDTFQDLDRCSLTRAIEAKQSYHLSRGDLEADVIDGSENDAMDYWVTFDQRVSVVC